MSIVFSLLVLLNQCPLFYTPILPPPDAEEITMEECGGDLHRNGNERGVNNLFDVYYSPSQSVVAIETDSTIEVVAYLIDSSNIVMDSVVVTNGTFLSVPQASGRYYVLLVSNNYSSKGSFYVN